MGQTNGQTERQRDGGTPYRYIDPAALCDQCRLFICVYTACIWRSWCHCHSLSLGSVKSRLVLHFWYRLTRVVRLKGPLNGCVYIPQKARLLYCHWKCRRSLGQQRYPIEQIQLTMCPTCLQEFDQTFYDLCDLSSDHGITRGMLLYLIQRNRIYNPWRLSIDMHADVGF